ncbi:esterase/lipase family protein [Schlegelella aquatica]|uniref:esterase/lipase family protein n=1 Tax=Caldimonas aquatica TaxID=376175 RepID=UPI003752AD1B
MAEQSTQERMIPVRYDERGNPYWESRMSPPDDSVGVCHIVPDRIVPVIFVPGVMGSNLRSSGEGRRWRMDSVWTALSWIWADAKERKRSLRPETMEVDDGGKVQRKMSVPREELRRRGWGEIAAMSYSAALRWLEENLNDYENCRDGVRVKLMEQALGAELGEATLTEDEVRLSYRYRFPVHACGYNWLDDNARSALRLGERIDQVLMRYRNEGKRCERVILVTHSMGGLVARYCSEVLGYRDKIYGIVHGVMPAIGAAAVYRRMKSGTEGGWAAAQVMGADAAEMTAVLSTAPGPLQLLPTPEYGNGWLRIRSGAQEVSLPRHGDPYSEIYTVRGKWWGLCDDELLNPLNEDQDINSRRLQLEKDWNNLEDLLLRTVRRFHLAIAQRYHPHTHAFCGDSEEKKAYGAVSWQQSIDEGKPLDEWMEGTAPHEWGRRRINQLEEDRVVLHPHGNTQARFSISGPDEAGDGTVPRRSGMAPKAHCRSFLRVAVEHEPAYNPEEGKTSLLALHFTVRAIVRIAQRVRETSTMMYDDLR